MLHAEHRGHDGEEQNEHLPKGVGVAENDDDDGGDNKKDGSKHARRVHALLFHHAEYVAKHENDEGGNGALQCTDGNLMHSIPQPCNEPNDADDGIDDISLCVLLMTFLCT